MYLVGFVCVVIALCLLLAIRVMASKFKETETVRAADVGILSLVVFLAVSFII
jgi:hypothetical protein